MKLLIFFSILLLSLSCSHIDEAPQHILEISESKNVDIQSKVKIRLALAKIVSLAFRNKEFRQYFKTNFANKNVNQPYLEECLLIEHLDDKVLSNGTSLKDFLNSISDFEVFGIYDGNLIDEIISNDKSVCIKMPDVFKDFNWNIDHMAPVVIAIYPEEFANSTFLGYHSYNDAEWYVANLVPQMLHVYVKASDDYLVIDKNSQMDVYGNELTNIIPQLNSCPEAKSEILNNKTSIGDNYIINLKQAFQTWKDQCGYKGSYLEVECDKECKRECSVPASTLKVLENISASNELLFQSNSDQAFKESFHFYIQFKEPLFDTKYSDFAIPALRFTQLGISYSAKEMEQDICDLPKVAITESFDKSNFFPADYLIDNKYEFDFLINYMWLQYGDVFYQKSYPNPKFPAANVFSNTNFVLGTSVYDYCSDPKTNSESGELKLLIRY